jgi:ABC-type uncharacterized transport system substrate-binding protein
MRRREFITLLGSTAAAWPVASRAQQAAMPVIGYLCFQSLESRADLLTPFRQGLNEAGYFEGQNLRKLAALLVITDSLFIGRREQIVARAASVAIPAIYEYRDFVARGGLMSYGPSYADMNRQAGIYVGRVLKGAKPADLPVMQPSKFELVINLKTAKTLGVTVPQPLLVAADEVIE